MDPRKATAARGFGLTLGDVHAISAAQSMIPWPITYDRGDEGELFAIIYFPKNSRVSAFLLDREGEEVVLTDNLSDPHRVLVTSYRDVEAAAAHVGRVLSGP